jgi:hypothetical protein
MIEHNFNTDSDFILSQAWYPATNMQIKKQDQARGTLNLAPNTHWLTVTYKQMVWTGPYVCVYAHIVG